MSGKGTLLFLSDELYTCIVFVWASLKCTSNNVHSAHTNISVSEVQWHWEKLKQDHLHTEDGLRFYYQADSQHLCHLV